MGKFLDKAGVTHLWQKIKSTLTGYMRTDGGNSLLLLSGGSGNTAGWRLVMEETMNDWKNCAIVLSVSSRHTGQGVLSIGFQTSTGTGYAHDIRWYGSTVAWTSGAWRAFYNTSTRKFRLYWHFNDYNNTAVNVLSRYTFAAPKSGAWYTSLPSDNGTELSIKINRADTADALAAARKLWGQSFDGSADVSGDLALANRKITWSGHGSNYVGDGGKDYSPTVGGELANLVISAWYGLSFTTGCDGTYKGKTSVGIDTRNGIVRAAKVEAATLSGSLAWGKLTGVPAMVSQLVTWGKFVTEVTPKPALNQVWAGGVNATSGVQATITFNKVNGKSILASGSTSGNIDTTPPVATQSANGLMSAADKKSFDAIKGKSVLSALSDIYTEQSADYVEICLDTTTLSLGGGETTQQKGVVGSIDMATQTVAGVMSAADKKKLDGLGVKRIAKGVDLGTLKERGLYEYDYKAEGSTSAADVPQNAPKSIAYNDSFSMLVLRTGLTSAVQIIFANNYTPTNFYIRSMGSLTSSVVNNRPWYKIDLSSLRTADE